MSRSNLLLQRLIAFGAGGINAVTWINLLLAVVAFGKDLMQAAYFGTSEAADALTLAYFLPDTIGSNLIASALGVACVPAFCKLLLNGETGRLRALVWRTAWAALLLTMACWLLLYVFEEPVLRALAPGLSPEVYALCKQLYHVMLPALILYPLVTIGGAVLQACGSFVPPALAPVLFNGTWLIALVGLLFASVPQEKGAVWAAVAIVIGACAMVILIIASLSRRSGTGKAAPRVKGNGDLRRIWRAFAPYLFILLCAQAVLAVERSIASMLGSGTVAGLSYAFRLSQFPNWVFVSALTTLLLPALAKASEQRDPLLLRESLQRAIKATLLLTVPVALFFYIAREPLVALLFQHGAFDDRSLSVTADFLSGYSLAIVGQALTAVGLRYFMAVERMRVPAVMALLALLVNVAADYSLTPWLGACGLGYGAACGAWLQGAALMWLVRQDLRNWTKASESR